MESKMSNQKQIQKISLVVVGLAAVAVVAVFASFRNRSGLHQEAIGKSPEYTAEAPKTWDVAFASSFGKEAPDFSVKDIEGRTHKLSDYRGRNVVVVFWATWCPACNLHHHYSYSLKFASRNLYKRYDLLTQLLYT